jgi:hypothetical protein
MEIKEVEFEGIVSGDYEVFCWDVTKETFIKIKGEKPNPKWDKSTFNEGLFKIYPNDIMPKKAKKVKVFIRVEVIEEEQQ